MESSYPPLPRKCRAPIQVCGCHQDGIHYWRCGLSQAASGSCECPEIDVRRDESCVWSGDAEFQVCSENVYRNRFRPFVEYLPGPTFTTTGELFGYLPVPL